VAGNTYLKARRGWNMSKLWTETKVGRMRLPHRLAMAPMTRSRALPDGTPSELAAEYYSQRASLGLLITEGTQPSEDGQGYLRSPGIYTEAHVAGWRKIADRVHAAGGYLYIQLMHVGRMSHPDNTPHRRQAVAPSAIAPNATIHTAAGQQAIPIPRELGYDEIRATVADFVHAAKMAVRAGADGVEIHGANGYLVHQFLSASANTRTDEYGGSIEKRARFAIETAVAVAEAIGAERTGIRISPGVTLGDIDEGEFGLEVYRYLVKELAKLKLAYLHMMHVGNEDLLRDIRNAWPTALLVNRPGRPRERLSDDIEAGLADVAPVGAWALANPDLVERLKTGAPLSLPDFTTVYGDGERGYTDYPTLKKT
jgi:2,4-dienoyl-CoA reductase-like NADH-dependent reductase (Old Yellow Enzyme family)